MKKSILTLLITFSVLIVQAQQWLGSGTSSNLIYRDGNVLVGGTSIIGTFAPSDRLIQVQAPINQNAFLTFRNQGSSASLDLAINNSFGRASIYANLVPLTFWTSSIERLRITNAGDIGIGTTTPTTKFEINSGISGIAGLKFTQLPVSSIAQANNGKVLSVDVSGNIILTTASGSSSGNWSIAGNSGTVDGINFIGTTDNVPLSIRVNNILAGRIEQASSNTFLGISTGINNSSTQNTAVGGNSFITNTSGFGNSAFGALSLYSNSTGSGNTGIGNSALQNNSIGNYNTSVGIYALNNNQSGTNNTVIGYSANTSTTALTNASAFGANALVNTSNKIRIGNTSVSVIEGQVDWSWPSDGRFKFNIKEDEVVGLQFINRLRPVVYSFDTQKFQEFLMRKMPDSLQKAYLNNIDFGPSSAVRRSGFVAQEVEKAAEEVKYNFSAIHVPANEDDNYSISYSEFVVPLVKAVQELSKENAEMKKQIEELRKMINGISVNSYSEKSKNEANESVGK